MTAMNIDITYYAILRDQRGLATERVKTDETTPAGLYDRLQASHDLTPPRSSLGVAVNDEICDWDRALADGDSVAFIPPVAGG